LLNAGLLDELMLLVHPLLLGGGRPLFAGVKDVHRLKMTRCETMKDGRALLVYRTSTTTRRLAGTDAMAALRAE
jgi:riboflavin biosynthesis pyrimidine reductase